MNLHSSLQLTLFISQSASILTRPCETNIRNLAAVALLSGTWFRGTNGGSHFPCNLTSTLDPHARKTANNKHTRLLHYPAACIYLSTFSTRKTLLASPVSIIIYSRPQLEHHTSFTLPCRCSGRGHFRGLDAKVNHTPQSESRWLSLRKWQAGQEV